MDTVAEIDRAIRLAQADGCLNPVIRDAFIDALLDRRLAAMDEGRVIEYATTEELVEHLFALTGDVAVFLEVGAFEAEFSVRAASEHPEAHVIALEANPYTWSAVAPTLPERIEYLNAAACCHDGRADLRIMSIIRGAHVPQIAGNNGLRERNDQGIEYEQVNVAAMTIDSVLADRGLTGLPCVLWIDVEGAQDLVLSGATHALRVCRAVLIEVEDRAFWQGQPLADDVDRMLTGAGLRCVARDREYPEQHNRLYVRASD